MRSRPGPRRNARERVKDDRRQQDANEEAYADDGQGEYDHAHRRRMGPCREKTMRDLGVPGCAHEKSFEKNENERNDENAGCPHQGTARVHEKAPTGGAVSIAKRIASPSGPPVANLRSPFSSNGAPNRFAVA